MGTVVIVLGVISSILFFIAAVVLGISGSELTDLSSRSGVTVAEKYYQEIGMYGIAYSLISCALGLGILSISCGLGGMLRTKGNK